MGILPGFKSVKKKFEEKKQESKRVYVRSLLHFLRRLGNDPPFVGEKGDFISQWSGVERSEGNQHFLGSNGELRFFGKVSRLYFGERVADDPTLHGEVRERQGEGIRSF